MAKTVANMLAGLADYFTVSGGGPAAALVAKIESRFWAVGSPQAIATMESLQGEPPSAAGQFVIFREASTTSGRLLGGKESKMRFTAVELGCFGRFQADAAALRDLVYAVIVDSFAGTWTAPGPIAVDIRGAHWDYDGETSDFDEDKNLCVAEAKLLVPWLSS